MTTRPKTRPLQRIAALLLVWTVALAAAAVAAEPLADRIDALVSKGALAQAKVGVLVERAGDGATLYARGADQLFIPASNQKILTVLASLVRFGPTHRFTTRTWAPQPIDGDGTVAELLVEGGGDPALGSEDWWRLAADLRREGLRHVSGNIRVDDSLFAGPSWHPSWGALSARAYHAPVGALSANYGAFVVSVWPRDATGSAPRVSVDPPVSYLRLRNLARTVTRRRGDLLIDRMQGGASEGRAEEIVRVEGTVRRGDAGDHFPRSVIDPGLYAGSLLLHQLRANAIEVDGEVRRAPRRAEEPLAIVLERPGRSLAEIARLCLKHSSNAIAETLVKDLGAWDGVDATDRPARAGDWPEGIAALRRTLAGLGVDLDRARLVDGSGLSIQNRLSPRMLVRALRLGADSFVAGPEFVAALPIAHGDGTLERRLEAVAGRIRAKTGLLSDARVTALSGFAEREDGERLVFSILVNGPGGGTEAGMDAVDRIARALVEAELPPANGAPGAPPAAGARAVGAD
ncbi:MAG: D-alanyl-D-alanine carboxypeptidase/D-alanyl-D-alanine-endopeptidase [Myxococcota bacterium]